MSTLNSRSKLPSVITELSVSNKDYSISTDCPLDLHSTILWELSCTTSLRTWSETNTVYVVTVKLSVPMYSTSSYGKLRDIILLTKKTCSSSRLKTKDLVWSPWIAQVTVWCSITIFVLTKTCLFVMLISVFCIVMNFQVLFLVWLECADSARTMLIVSFDLTNSWTRSWKF